MPDTVVVVQSPSPATAVVVGDGDPGERLEVLAVSAASVVVPEPASTTVVAQAAQGPPGPTGAPGPAGDQSQSVILAPTTSTRNVIQPQSEGVVGLVVRSAANQSADLMQFQGTDGTPYAGVNASTEFYAGDMRLTADSVRRASFARLSFGGDNTSSAFGFNWLGGSVPAALVTMKPNNAATRVLRIDGASGQTADLTQWRNDDATVLARIESSGSGVFDTSATSGAHSLRLRQSGTGGAAFLRAENGSGNIVAAITSSGAYSVGDGTFYGSFEIYRGSGKSNRIQLGDTSSAAVVIDAPTAAAFPAMLRLDVGAAASVGEVIKGAASQTANLQQWQNSAGTAVARVAANGDTTVRNLIVDNGNGGATIAQNGAGNGISIGGLLSSGNIVTNESLTASNGGANVAVGRVGPTAGANREGGLSVGADVVAYRSGSGALSVQAASPATGTTFAVRALSGQTADLTRWQDSAGAALATVNAAGQVGAPAFRSLDGVVSLAMVGGGTQSASLSAAGGFSVTGKTTIDANSGNIVGLTVKTAAASPTADFIQVQNSATTNIFRVRSTGQADFAGFNSSAGGFISSGNAGVIGLQVRSVASQTADLQEWQNSSGSSVAMIESTGQLSFAAGLGVKFTSPDGAITKTLTLDNAGDLLLT
jgi:hypothetical protein